MLAFVALGLQADVIDAWGLSFDNCCNTGNIMGGTCPDGSCGPCCGVGSCNSFCCGCDGGCRKPWKDQEERVWPITEEMKKLDLNQWPMLSAHDAATAYAQSDTCSPHTPINNWAVTQARGGFPRLLSCGARAFDLRPYLQEGGTLIMHHGTVLFHTEVKEAVQDVVEWSKEHPDTFVLIIASHCDGEDQDLKGKCKAASDTAFSNAGVKQLLCDDIARMSLGTAMKLGKQGDGGSVLFTWEWCVQSNFDQAKDIKCYSAIRRRLGEQEDPSLASEFSLASKELLGNGSAVEGDDARRLTLAGMGSCYGDEADKDAAFRPFWAYVDKVCNTEKPPYEGRAWLWQAQAHWQYDDEAIVEGTARRSCILWDEEKSHVNHRVAAKIKENGMKHINILEVDHLCDHGADIGEALHKYVLSKLPHAEEKYEQRERAVAAHGVGSATVWLAAALVLLGALAFGALSLRRHSALRQGRDITCEGSAEEARESLRMLAKALEVDASECQHPA